MKKHLLVFLTVILLITSVQAQVDQIRSASSSRGSGRSFEGGSGGGGASFFGDFIFNFMFTGVVDAQQQKLSRRSDVPTMVSLDLLLQTAVQPASYYIVNPRIRGNWGLFSTDYRMNYIIEEGIDGLKHIRTNDWQVLSLNLVTTRDVLFRIGGGFIQETFGAENNFAEWTTGFHYQPPAKTWGGVVEYRGSEVRREVSGFAQYRFLDAKRLHGFFTIGAVYQRHYTSITTWGMQGGLMLRVY